jgi:hypothetical protein
MKGRVLERLVQQHVLPALPEGFMVQGSLVYRQPVGYFLHCLRFGTSSSEGDRVTVEAIVQPLYVPKKYLVLTFGFDVGTGVWYINERDPGPGFVSMAEKVQQDAVPFFGRLDGLDRFCENVPILAVREPRKVYPLTDPAVSEPLAYAELLRGRKKEGLHLIEDTIARETADSDPIEERVERADRVRDAVTTLGLEAGQALLEQWRSETIQHLGIQE